MDDARPSPHLPASAEVIRFELPDPPYLRVVVERMQTSRGTDRKRIPKCGRECVRRRSNVEDECLGGAGSEMGVGERHRFDCRTTGKPEIMETPLMHEHSGCGRLMQRALRVPQ